MTFTLAELERRDKKIDALEDGIRRELTPVELRIVHHFSKGVYAREMHIPAGVTLTGKVHKHENLNIMSRGRMMIFMEDGTTKLVEAPYTVVSPPGTRRAAHALTAVVWTTIHGTDLTDVAEIEAEFVAKSPADYRLFFEEQRKQIMNKSQVKS